MKQRGAAIEDIAIYIGESPNGELKVVLVLIF